MSQQSSAMPSDIMLPLNPYDLQPMSATCTLTQDAHAYSDVNPGTTAQGFVQLVGEANNTTELIEVIIEEVDTTSAFQDAALITATSILESTNNAVT